MKAIGAVDVGVAGWSEHNRVPACLADKAVRGWVIDSVGLCFDDDAANAIDAEVKANQLDCDLIRRSVPETSKILVGVRDIAAQAGSQGHQAICSKVH